MTRSNSQNFSDMANKLGISEEIARIMVYRGIDTKEKINNYLNMKVSDLHSPLLMQDMEKAIDIIKNKIDSKKNIRIVGDYDVDGIMSTFILLKGLKEIGANVDYIIPDRVTDGYGINESIINKAYEDGIDTILTCDNGIAAIEQINHANELGMTVVVTDHHNIVFKENDSVKEYILPNAAAVVNPHRPQSEYPFQDICGAVVAFKLIYQLYEDLNIDKGRALQFLEFAGIATVCDIMPLLDENRVIVKECLKMLMNTKNIGLKELIKQKQVLKNENSVIDTYHLGFIIGPCFNASGRLKTATLSIELLECDDEQRVSELASELVMLNDERKKLTVEGTLRVFEQIDSSDIINDKVIVVFDEECHESIAGIIAGRVREKYLRPAIVITRANDDMCKGSARSIEGYHIHQELTRVSHLLEKFGGHPMAAGLSLREENICILREELNRNCKLTDDDLVDKILIDIVKNPGEVTLDLVRELEILEPFGTANDKPVFAASKVRIVKIGLVGKIKKYLKFELQAQGRFFGAMYFGEVSDFENMITDKYSEKVLEDLYNGNAQDVMISILYYPQTNTYNNHTSVSIVIKSIRC